MCLSPEADLIGGVVISAIGIDVLFHVSDRREVLGLATLPLLFGAHQLVETFVWWGLQGHVPGAIGDVAMWAYLLFAFVVLPVYVPLAVRAIEPPGPRRRVIDGLTALGAVVSTVLLVAMLRGPVAAELRPYHLSYSTALPAGGIIVGAYVTATCGSFLFSGNRYLVMFGVVNIVAVASVAALVVSGFASLWCAWAAVMSAAFALYLRRSERGLSVSKTATVSS
ncbi:DUF6629 family protein [Ilumatobacter nonamiensis]|uniref:DUF6629 family protein n=1 Tax=Ilumatobacter nonamiensis TaxID=467093 RepID=UPI000344FE4C|nr:DUF6629 family protein [Ilumatobacter nonamiensis]